MNLLTTRSLLQKSLIRKALACGMIAASLAFVGNTAMAADAHVKAPAKVAQVTHARVTRYVATPRRASPTAQLNVGIGQFIQSMLGGPLPPQYSRIVQNALNAAASRKYAGSRGSYDDSFSPSYDNSAQTPAGCAACDAQAASDQEVQEIQQMNDINAMNASNAAAAEQNAADTAATLQTEINAGM
jgi:hypothetical protein